MFLHDPFQPKCFKKVSADFGESLLKEPVPLLPCCILLLVVSFATTCISIPSTTRYRAYPQEKRCQHWCHWCQDVRHCFVLDLKFDASLAPTIPRSKKTILCLQASASQFGQQWPILTKEFYASLHPGLLCVSLGPWAIVGDLGP